MDIESEITANLRYDAETGKLFWRTAVGRAPAGAEAGGVTVWGYRRVGIGGRDYPAHRLIWLMSYGEWPKKDIDHIDGDTLNNRLSNLRDVTRSTNLRNTRRQAHNTSGVTGVSRANHLSYPAWIAHWHDNNGKRQCKWFSVNRYGGEEAAKQLAIEYRKARIAEVGNYTARHGL